MPGSVTKEHRQTIGDHHSTSQSGLPGEGAIRRMTVFGTAVQWQHFNTMHLLHEHRSGTQDRLQLRAIARDVLGPVSHMRSKVQAIPRRE